MSNSTVITEVMFRVVQESRRNHQSTASRMRLDHEIGLHATRPLPACDECFDQLDQEDSPDRQRFNRAFFPSAN